MTTGLAQRGGAFDDGDLEAVLTEPVGEHGPATLAPEINICMLIAPIRFRFPGFRVVGTGVRLRATVVHHEATQGSPSRTLNPNKPNTIEGCHAAPNNRLQADLAMSGENSWWTARSVRAGRR